MFLLTCFIGLLGWVLVLVQSNKLNKLRQSTSIKTLENVKVKKEVVKSTEIDISNWRVGDIVKLDKEYWLKSDFLRDVKIIDIFPDNSIVVQEGDKKDILNINCIERNHSATNRSIENKMSDNVDYKQALQELQIQFL